MTAEQGDHSSTGEETTQGKDIDLHMPVIDAANADVDIGNDSKAKFLNGKDVDENQVIVEVGSSQLSFTGLGKEDLLPYATDPFWVRFRMILFILFWVVWLGMLAAAIVIIVLAPRCPHRPGLIWYEKEVVYQVYPESFKDATEEKTDIGAGTGDLKGIESKIGYLDELNVNILWLNSIFDADEYGVLNLKDVKMKIGTKDDILSLLKKFKKQDKKLLLDFIISYTSANHEWFKKSKLMDKMYKHFYVWTNSTSKPTDPVNPHYRWKLEPARNEYYMYRKSESTPVLNLLNEDVVKEIQDTMKYWLSLGVAGFHVNDAEDLVFSSSGDRNTDASISVIQQLRTITDSYNTKPGREKLLFATLPSSTGNDSLAFFGSSDKPALDLITNHALIDIKPARCAAECIKSELGEIMEAKRADKRISWMLGNDNVERLATRVGDVYSGGMMALQLLLPGTPFSYYGDEVGMLDSGANGDERFRSPMQWTDTENAGFSQFKPWTVIGPEYRERNVNYMKAHFTENSKIDIFSSLAELRRSESFQWGKVKYLENRNDLLWFIRDADGFSSYLVLINFGNRDELFSDDNGMLPKKGTVAFHSGGAAKKGEEYNLQNGFTLKPGEVVVYEMKA